MKNYRERIEIAYFKCTCNGANKDCDDYVPSKKDWRCDYFVPAAGACGKPDEYLIAHLNRAYLSTIGMGDEFTDLVS
jgi:hypothetical protein